MEYTLILLVLIALWMGYTFNKLVRRSNMADNQKSQIDIQLNRRFDLIPNLVEVVKAYAKHEKSTLEAVVKARNLFLDSKDTEEKLRADQELNSALSRLLVVVEAYPELLANQNFMNLQHQLTETENKIAFSRQFYNDSVYKYNTVVQMFPSNIIASLFKFKLKKYFEIEEHKRENTDINID